MILEILLTLLVVIWTTISLFFVFILIKHRHFLINFFKSFKLSKNNLSDNTQYFEQIKRSLEEFNKISNRLKK
jgi:hypothetical protein